MTAEEHLELARDNETLARSLLATRTDWAVTVFFYSALHLLEAVLIGRGETASSSHVARQNVLLRHPDIWRSGVYDEYERLSSKSRRARYDGWRPAQDDEELQRHVRRFERVRDALTALL